MKIRIEKMSKYIIYFYFIIFAFLLLFTFNDEHIDNAINLKNMVVPYINFNYTMALCILSAISAIIIAIVSKKKLIDNVSLLLLFRACIYFIPILYMMGDFKIGTLFSAFQCFLVYFIGSNSNVKSKAIINILTIFSLIIALEVFYTLLYNNISVFSNEIKWFMVIPIGKSNYISCYLLPQYVIVSRYYENKKIFYYLYTLIMFLAILGTGSKLALVLISVYIIYQTFKDIILKKRIPTKKILIFLFRGTALFIVALLFISYNSSGFNNILSRFTSNNIFESRFYVYNEALNYFLNNPIFGRSAFAFKAYDSYKAHNFILESLVETGILGTIIFIIAIVLVYKKINKVIDYRLRYSLIGFITIILIQGLIEPNLFIVSSDTFFWLTIGTLLFSKNTEGEFINDN